MKTSLRSIVLIFCLAIISTGSFAQWVSKAPALKKRSEATSVVYNGKLYVFFGFSDTYLNIEPSSEVYNPALNTWTLLSSPPSNKAVTHQGVALIDDKVWHIGGRVGKHPGPVTSETWIYNISSNSWSAGPQIIDPATGNPLLWAGGGAALLGRTLHVFGGFTVNACNNDQGSYHLTLDIDKWLLNPSQPAQWKNELAPMPLARNHLGTVVLGGKIYAIGGQYGHDCGGGQDKQFSHVYNPATNIWTELPLLPTPRSHAEGSTFAIDGKIYVVAGQGTSGTNTNKVTIFNPAANNGLGAWADDTNLTLPTIYEGLSSKVIGSTFIISHGGEGSSGNTRNTTYSRTITRTPVNKLGFSSGCANIKTLSGNSITAKTLLFTIDGTKSYTTSSNAAWLTVTKNATGTAIPNAVDIELTANAQGLTPGNYSAIVTAAGTAGGTTYSAATYCVNLTVEPRVPEISTTIETVFSGIQGTVSAAKPVIITNSGSANLQISKLNITGTNLSAFSISSSPALPFNIPAGQTYTLNLKFNPPASVIGALSASLNISSNDADENSVVVGLYGLSALGEQGSKEPPLDGVVKTLGYKINVGGTGLILSTGPAAIGDEVLKPLFQKAGTGPVTMKAVARYSPDDLLAYGFYTKTNGTPVLTEIGKIALNQEQTLLPLLTSGSKTSFDPGSSTFGFYTGATSYANQNTYTEDELNTGPLPHSVRIYPLKNRAGIAVANSYLVAFEPASNGDYQDYVFKVTNVKPAAIATSGILEAELALLNKVIVASNRAGYTGTGFGDYINSSGDYIEWTLDKADASATSLAFRYANGSTSNRPLQVMVNGQVVTASMAFPATGEWAQWSTSVITANLVSGINKIRLTAIGSSGANIDHLAWSNAVPEPEISSGLLEAELASLNRVVVSSKFPGFTGIGYTNYINNSGDYIEWTINKTNASSASFNFRYANGSTSNRPLQVQVNGQVIAASLAFPVTGGWTSWSTSSITANLISGINKIRLTAIGSSGANIDHLAWSNAVPEPEISSGLLEAELASLNRVVVSSKFPGFTGIGYTNYINNSGDYIQWTIDKQVAGSILLSFRYANGASINRPLKLEVNGEVVASGLSFNPTGGWETWLNSTITANLISGNNQIRLTAIGSSGPNVDHLAWSNAGATITKKSFIKESIVLNADLKLSVSPNPVIGTARILVSTSSSLRVNATLIDMSGKVHRKFSPKNSSNYFYFPVNDLPSGVYMIFINQGSKSASARFIVTNK
jgi:hypothetical protein